MEASNKQMKASDKNFLYKLA